LDGTDSELVYAAKNGDDSAFHALLDRYAPILMPIAVSLSPRRQDAEDLLQETFIGAYRGLKNFEGRSSLKTWLVQILTRQAAKSWHRTRHHRRTMSIDQQVEASGPRVSFATDSAPGPAQVVEQKLDVAAILESLPQPYHEVLVLREMRGMSYDEMAEALGVPRGTIESRLFRARAEFRRRMESTNRGAL
jgi:RNA polymerase sigma-70 factor (ECF subfamily)